MTMIERLVKEGYEVHLMFVDVPLETAIARAASRAANPKSATGFGRIVPLEVIKESHQRAAANFFTLKDMPGLASVRLFDNTGDKPRAVFEKKQYQEGVTHDKAQLEKYRRKAFEDVGASAEISGYGFRPVPVRKGRRRAW